MVFLTLAAHLVRECYVLARGLAYRVVDCHANVNTNMNVNINVNAKTANSKCECKQQKWTWRAILGFHRKPDSSLWTLHLSCISASFIVSMPLISGIIVSLLRWSYHPLNMFSQLLLSHLLQLTDLPACFLPLTFKNPTTALCFWILL